MVDTITKKDLTGGEKEGSGLYDELMRAGKSHISEEYAKGTLSGKDFATVYLGMMQANLSTASQFVLQAPITSRQLLLLDEQIAQAQKQNELLELQKAQLSIANETAQYNLDVTLVKQSVLLDKQALQLDKQNLLLDAQLTQTSAQTSVVNKQGSLLDKQILSEGDKTATPQYGLNRAAYDKTLAEVSILEQKKLTEQKQTTGTIADTGGLIGAELKLKDNQAESFNRDAEQKAMKMFIDVFSVMYATEPEELVNQEWGLGSDESKKILTRLMAGINAGVPD